MEKISVILADDHGILRYGLRIFLQKADDIVIAGEASNGPECIALFKKEKPDVCLIDIGMPGKNGIEVAQAILDAEANAKIIFLSMYSDKLTLRKALSLNVSGYLAKNTAKQNILEGIRAVYKGNHVFGDFVPKEMIPSGNGDSSNGFNDKITEREMEIISLVVAGYSSPEIAEKLFISRRTVDTHRNNIMQKLNISNTASLVRLALQNDLVDSLPHS